MKYIRQFTIICGISLVGEALNFLLQPLPIPASIWGMLLLFILLCTKIIRLEQVQDAADFLFIVMPLTFIPLGAQLLEGYGALKNDLAAIAAICVVSTFVVFIVTSFFVQIVRNKQAHKEEE